MNKKTFFLSLGCLFWSSLTIAQIDTLYIGKYKHSYGITTSIRQEFLALSFEGDRKTLAFEPNRPVNLGLAFSWKNSSLSYAYGFSGMRDKQKGRSTTVDFQYHVLGKNVSIDFYFQQYKGFYLEQPDLKQYLHFNDLRITMYGGRFTYIFNSDKYSIAAANNKRNIQKKSAGTLLLGGSSFLSGIKNTPEIIDGITMDDKRTFSFDSSIGYAYNWVVWDKLLIAPSFSVGINGIFDENRMTKNTKFYVNGQIASTMNIMYQGENWGVGITSSLSAIYLEKVEGYATQLSNKNFSFFINKRFSLKKTPKVLEYDLIDLLHRSSY